MSITLELPDHLQAQAEELAARRGESIEALVQEALELYLNAPTKTLPLEERQKRNQARLQRYYAQHGVEWDRLSEAERELLISQLVHEAR
jgi:hypothetical protein